jgi:arginine/lysine/ornithine decarboxylase
MIYPPGIPIAIPGELITKDALDLIAFYQAHGGVLLSDSPEGYIHVIDQSIWYKGSDIDYEY